MIPDFYTVEEGEILLILVVTLIIGIIGLFRT